MVPSFGKVTFFGVGFDEDICDVTLNWHFTFVEEDVIYTMKELLELGLVFSLPTYVSTYKSKKNVQTTCEDVDFPWPVAPRYPNLL